MENNWRKLTTDNEEEVYAAVDKGDGVVLCYYDEGTYYYFASPELSYTIHTHAKWEDMYFTILKKPLI